MYFPHPNFTSPEGILALGGDLSAERLILAYRWGIFPWYNEGEPIQWWHPDPRFVLFPSELKISKSMKQLLAKNTFRVSFDQAFVKIISHCKEVKRAGQESTWITDEMEMAYIDLHDLGYAHSVEVWEKEELVGGLYGIAIGKMFFGESMFSLKSNASKFGFINLVEELDKRGFKLIDCQQETAHLASLGARLISRSSFMDFIRENMRIKEDLIQF